MRKKIKRIRFDLLPGIFLFAFLPLVARAKLVETGLDGYSWFSDEHWQYDFFMYWKSVVFLILVLWMAGVLLDRFLLQRYRDYEWKRFLPLLVYGGLAVLSAILSANRRFAFKGMWQQYESIWVLLGYLVTVYYCSHIVRERRDIICLLSALCVGAAFQAALGFLQMAGADFFSSSAGKKILTLGLDSSLKDSLQYSFAENAQNKVYMASYHPNYAGVYVVLVWTVLFFMGLTTETRKKKAVCMAVAAALLICLIGSGSKTGMLISMFQILAIVLWGNPVKGKRWTFSVACAILLLGSLVLYDMAEGHILKDAFESSVHKTEKYDLEEISPGKDSVRLCYNGHSVELSAQKTEWGDTLVAVDDSKGLLPVLWNQEEQYFEIEDETFRDIKFDSFVDNKTAHIYILYEKIAWHFEKTEQSGSYVYITQFGKTGEIKNAENVLKGWEKALSGRGYIWGRTLPLLKKHFLLGSGSDTFMVEFPQTDYVMRANTGLGMFVDIPSKAHSMYLQTSLQTGILSLLCLLVFWGKYIKRHLRMEREKDKGQVHRNNIGTGIFLGVFGYLLMGFLNDSVLATAPIFWGLLGLGMAWDEMRIK